MVYILLIEEEQYLVHVLNVNFYDHIVFHLHDELDYQKFDLQDLHVNLLFINDMIIK